MSLNLFTIDPIKIHCSRKQRATFDVTIWFRNYFESRIEFGQEAETIDALSRFGFRLLERDRIPSRLLRDSCIPRLLKPSLDSISELFVRHPPAAVTVTPWQETGL